MQSSKQATDSHRHKDAWTRDWWVWIGLFIVGFGGPLLIVWLDPSFAAHKWWMLAIVLLMFSVHIYNELCYLPQNRGSDNERPASAFVVFYVFICIGGWYMLSQFAPIFMMALSVVFPLFFRAVRFRFAIVITVFLIAAVAVRTVGGWDAVISGEGAFYTLVLIFMPTTLAAIGIGGWIHFIINQSYERRELIETLERTQLELAQVERARGILQERHRLAHEIHDTLAQGFTSIVTNLEAADQALPASTPIVEKHIKRARQTARDSLEQARRVVADLRPQPLDEYSFAEAFERVVANWSDTTEIEAVATVTGDPQPMTPQTEVALLRVIQESLNNIYKHAQAQNVNATLSYMDDMVVLDMQDDGVGLALSVGGMDGGRGDSAEKHPLSGYGLIAMRERIEQLKGSLAIESAPEMGTTIVAELPL